MTMAVHAEEPDVGPPEIRVHAALARDLLEELAALVWVLDADGATPEQAAGNAHEPPRGLARRCGASARTVSAGVPSETLTIPRVYVTGPHTRRCFIHRVTHRQTGW